MVGNTQEQQIISFISIVVPLNLEIIRIKIDAKSIEKIKINLY